MPTTVGILIFMRRINFILIEATSNHTLLFQTAEFFLFAALMFVDTIVFMIMTVFYKYKPNSLYLGDYTELENDTSTLVDQEEREEIPLQEKEKEQ